MNCFAGFTKETPAGFLAMLRFAEDGQAEPVMAPGGKPMVYPTEVEAWRAVTASLLRYFNGKMRREGVTITSARAEANRIFRKGRVILVESR